MSKAMSLKLQEEVFAETEKMVKQLNIPRNRYINEALMHFNAYQKKKSALTQLAKEASMDASESLAILAEFDGFIDEGLDD